LDQALTMSQHDTYQTPLSRSVSHTPTAQLNLIQSSTAAMLARKWRIFSPLRYSVRRSTTPSYLLICPHTQNRYHTWRKLWLTLATAEKQLGLDISDAAIEEMKQNLVCTPLAVLRAYQGSTPRAMDST
jgi:hypothetical protein